MLRRIVMVLGLAVSYSVTLHAAYPLVTEDVFVLGRDGFELEGSYSNWRTAADDSSRNCFSAFSLAHGVTDKMQISFSSLFQLDPFRDERVGRGALGLKFQLVKDLFSIGVANELGESAYFVNGIFTRQVNPLLFHVNLGYLATGDETAEGSLFYSAAVEYPVSGRFELVGEVTGLQAGIGEWLGGVRYRLNETLFISGAFSNGFRAVSDRFSFGIHTEF